MTASVTAVTATPQPSLLADSMSLAARHLRLMSRRPASIIGAIVMPVMFAILFFTVFSRVMERAGIDYVQYLLPAIVIQAAFFSAMSGAVWAAEDASSGMILRLRSLPIARSAPVLSLLIGEVARALLSCVVLLIVGYIFGFRFETGLLGFLAFLGIVAVAGAAIILPYLVLGFTLAKPEAAQALGGIIYFPMLLVSTLFVPVQAYPGWMQPIVENQPLSQITQALRAVSTQGVADTTSTLLIAGAWIVGLLVVFGALAPRVFGRIS